MSTFSLSWFTPAPPECRGGSLAIGNFDGVHLGHQALLAKLQKQKRPAVAITFDPHPLAILRPQHFQPVLTTSEYRGRLMHDYGADHVILLQTTPKLLQLSAADFFQRVVRGSFEARAMVEGFNFGFGRDREGTIETLRTLCEAAGMSLTPVPPVELDGKPVSSSRVRAALLAGDVQGATKLLGRAFRARGVVGKGAERGRTLGFPTANLEQIATVIPAEGVYAVRALHDGKTWPAAANVGPNPTFGDNAKKLEVHLIGFQGQLYGETLEIDFIARLRDTRPFAGANELQEQLKRDIAEAQRQLGDSAV